MRKQRLAAVAKAHDAWIDANLAEADEVFDPAEHPKPGSDYNQHVLDVDASGATEDEFVAMVNAALGETLTAAGDPDWDPKEHPRGPDGKFIDKTSPAFFEKLGELSTAQSVAYLKGDDYGAQQIGQEIDKLKKDGLPAAKPAAKAKPPAKPITAWTKTIHTAKYGDGEVVAVNKKGKSRLVWDGKAKKFVLEDKNSKGDWQKNGVFTKKGAYDAFKNDKTNWSVPEKEDITPAPKTEKVFSPQFEILPKEKRGKSGDGYYVPGLWGKYGAAGLMMRHVDDKGEARFLLVQANMEDNPDTLGKWQLPGGAIEQFETPEQGAAREAHEELGFSQEFLHQMKQGETHKVTVTKPGYPPWSYSNITVDVPTPEKMKWDRNELGGAKWVTAAELAQMRKNGEIIAPLEANLDAVLGKFSGSAGATPTPAVQTPAFMPSAGPYKPGDIWASTIPKSETGTGKDKITVSFPDNDAGDEVTGRIVHMKGKVQLLNLVTDQVMYTGKSVTDVLEQISKQYGIPIKNHHDSGKVTVYDATQPDLDLKTPPPVPKISGAPTEPDTPAASPLPTTVTVVKLKPFNEDGTPFVGYKASYKTFNQNDEHIGAVHENYAGGWTAQGATTHKSFMPVASKPYATQTAALKALEKAEKDYQKAQTAKPGKPIAGKKLPKLSVDKIEKQNGVPPKTLTKKQKTDFLYRFMYTGPYGHVTPDMFNTTTLFAALVSAVNLHNKTESPKLNLLQAINIADSHFTEIYGHKVNQKAQLIDWLQTYAGKSVASQILQNVFIPGTAPGAPPSSIVSTTSTETAQKLAKVPSAYDISTPAKLKAGFYNKIDVAEASSMQEKMEQGNSLTLQQQRAVERYVGGSEPFNEPLRGLDPHFQDYQVDLIQNLQEAMRPLPEAITVWRNTEGLGEAISAKTIQSLGDLEKFEGAILQDPAFLSTSLSAGVFNSNGLFELVISLPEGTPAVFAHDYQGGHGYESEQEMLLAAGLQYRIDSFEYRTTYSGQKYRIYMTVVPKVVLK